jgi:hypothetical protein
VRVVATLDITHISAMRGCNATCVTRWHTEQHRNHVLREDGDSDGLGLEEEMSLRGCAVANARRVDGGADGSGRKGSELT